MNTNPLKIEIALGLIIVFLVAAIIFVHWWSRGRGAKNSVDVDINDVIEQVELSLRAGEEKRIAAKQERLFEVKSFDLEINFVVKTNQSRSGGLETRFIAVSADSQIATERTQKIMLHMDVAPQRISEVPAKSLPIETNGNVERTSEMPLNRSPAPGPNK